MRALRALLTTVRSPADDSSVSPFAKLSRIYSTLFQNSRSVDFVVEHSENLIDCGRTCSKLSSKNLHD